MDPEPKNINIHSHDCKKNKNTIDQPLQEVYLVVNFASTFTFH